MQLSQVPPSTQRNPSRHGWGCLVFGPMLLRLDSSVAPSIRIGKCPHGRDLGQVLSQIAPMQWGLRMVGRRMVAGGWLMG